MQSLAIIGGFGFIGQSLLKLYEHNTDYKIRVLLRRESNVSIDSDGIQIIQGDLTDESSLDALIQPESIVINLAYIEDADKKTNLDAVRTLVNKCKLVGVKRFIHCSSTSVYGAVKNRVVTEETNCQPKTQYEITKFEIEKLLISEYSKAFELIILRPTAVFGENVKNLVKFVESIKAGNSIINYLRVCLYWKRRMNLVSVDTVASSIKYLSEYIRLGTLEKFIISEDDVVENNFYDIEKCLRKLLGIKGYKIPVFPIPRVVLKSILYLRSRSNINPDTIYSNKKLAESGFEKPYGFIESLQSYVNNQDIN